MLRRHQNFHPFRGDQFIDRRGPSQGKPGRGLVSIERRAREFGQSYRQSEPATIVLTALLINEPLYVVITMSVEIFELRG